MRKFPIRPAQLPFFFAAFAASSILALTTGCASGGYHLTRQYAGWLNSQQLIIRIVLYILTSFVFAVTLLVDSVIFNTMDFWEGRVSAGDYHFKDGEQTYFVHHEILPNSQLKRSTIEIQGAGGAKLQQIVLQQTQAGEIEMLVDGKLRTHVHGISELPTASLFDGQGRIIGEKVLVLQPAVALNRVRN